MWVLILKIRTLKILLIRILNVGLVIWLLLKTRRILKLLSWLKIIVPIKIRRLVINLLLLVSFDSFDWSNILLQNWTHMSSMVRLQADTIWFLCNYFFLCQKQNNFRQFRHLSFHMNITDFLGWSGYHSSLFPECLDSIANFSISSLILVGIISPKEPSLEAFIKRLSMGIKPSQKQL